MRCPPVQCPLVLFVVALAGCWDASKPGPADLASVADLASISDLTSARDAAPDLATPTDAATPPTDGGSLAGLTAEAGKYLVSQNCQPIVMPDPFTGFLDVRLYNGGRAPVGPVHVYGLRVIDGATGKTLQSYTPMPIADQSVQPMSSVDLHVVNTPGTAMPQDGCNVLKCNASVRIVVDWGPPNAQATQSTASPLTNVGCVF